MDHSHAPSTSYHRDHGKFDAKFINTISEQMGIQDLSHVASKDIADHVTMVVKNILGYAKKFQAGGRRRRMIVEDIESAMQFYGLPPQFGFYSKDVIPFRYVGTSGQDLFIEDDKEIDLSTCINAQVTKLPLEPLLKGHWLVIDGIQPTIPENPVPEILPEDVPMEISESKHDKIDNGPLLLNQLAKNARKSEHVQVKTTTSHKLSMEQQVFFREIIDAIMSSDEAKRNESLQTLQSDPGIQSIIPRFSLSIAEGVRCNIVQKNLTMLIYLMLMINSLVNNPAISLEKYLHELIPAILSCILGKQLSHIENSNHWALREYAARLLFNLVKKYKLSNIRSRVIKVLAGVFTRSDRVLASIYGAVFALDLLGAETVRSVLIPRALELYTETQGATVDRSAAEKLHKLMVTVFTNYVKTQKLDLKTVEDFRRNFEGFGNDIYRVISSEAPNLSIDNNPAKIFKKDNLRNNSFGTYKY